MILGMKEHAEDWVANIAADVEKKRAAKLSPREVMRLRNLAREIRLEHPIFGSLQVGWEINLHGMRWITFASVIPIGAPPGSRPIDDSRSSGDVDHAALLEMLARGERGFAIRTLAEFVRDALREHANHEIDEQILAAGKRIYDPHANEHPMHPSLKRA